MIIYLIGFRCTGKTTSGKILAGRLGYTFFDTDLYIKETEKRDIAAIVEENGWDYFRDLETVALKKASSLNNAVVSTGGGIIEREINRAVISETGFCAWLKADEAVIAQRLCSDRSTKGSRPSLTKLDPDDEIFEVLKKRQPIYENSAEFIIDTSVITPDKAADEIYQYINKGEKIER